MEKKQIRNLNLFHGDNMEFMKDIPDKYYDLAVVDPPYGIGITQSGSRLKKYNSENTSWDNSIPNKDYFDELFRISKNQIIWGANYFLDYLGATKCFLIYDKKQPQGVSFASCELAWTSFCGVAKTFYYSPMQMKDRIHSCQKPVKLYEWIYLNYAKQGDKIIDTHLGSGSSRIAAYRNGFDFVGFEIDKDYYEAQEKRFKTELMQPRLF